MSVAVAALIGPSLAKAAGAGVAKVASWGAKAFLEERRRRTIRSLVHSKARAAQLEALSELKHEQALVLADFCQSLEIEKFATALSSASLIEGAGKGADKLLLTLKEEFAAAMRLWMGDPIDDLVVKAVWEALFECVTKCIAPLNGRGKVAPTLEAELIATVGSMAAASVRNTELLQGLGNIEDIHGFEVALKGQIAGVHGMMRLPHAGTTRQVPYDQLFVDPYVAVEGIDVDLTGQTDAGIEVHALVIGSLRSVILGDPGGGKSTLTRKLMFDIAADRVEGLQGRVPFYLELRDYAASVRGQSRQTLIEYLEGVCKSPYNIEAPKDAIEYLLLNNRAVVLLDGLDELLDVSLRRDVVQAVEGFAHLYPTCPMLVTSRRVGYAEAALNASLFTHANLSEFNGSQVKAYVQRWFALDEGVESSQRGQLARSFMVDSQFVSDLRVNPLMLSLMCGIYASENYIPRNRPDVYEKCALLLFERWDKQRGIIPDLSFDAHVQSALRALALHIFEAESANASEIDDDETPHSEGIGRRELTSFLSRYLREKRFDNDEDAETAAIKFLDFCKGRAWVLTDVGAETYGFTHRTFLEYFAASQLVRLNTSADALYARLKDDVRNGKSDVVAQLALQILGRNTEDGADDFLDLVVRDASGSEPADINSISFAARALHFVVPRPDVLKAICDHAVRLRDNTKPMSYLEYLDPVEFLMRCSPENAPRVAAAMRESFTARFADNSLDERLLALVFLEHRAVNDFWRAWVAENTIVYRHVLEKARKKYYWTAVLEYERGVIDLSQLLKRHGIKSLYDFTIDRLRDRPPFVYRFLSRATHGGFEGLSGPVNPERSRQIAQEILSVLPERPGPWMRWKNDYRSTASILLKTRGRHAIEDAVRILLALPLLEIADVKTSRMMYREFEEIISQRQSNEQVLFLNAETLLLFSDFPSALGLVQAWVSDDFSLIRNPPKEKQVIE
ncbi:NACHT domain-containing protein [Paenarthrobacter sp. FR1]|uniref:NACHT domain-containing protein n=1 Tax=Paenarthrobacter sp. FR1 TaxID=3439548 RepID=UPI003DA4E725